MNFLNLDHELLAYYLCVEEEGKESAHDLLWQDNEPFAERWYLYIEQAQKTLKAMQAAFGEE